jgi:putative membrane protein
MPPGRLLTTLVLACCLAVSASYELIEFAAAMALGQGANEFLGAQGDAWDTQWDMLTCLIGAVFAVVLLSRFHDRRLGQQFALRSAE